MRTADPIRTSHPHDEAIIHPHCGETDAGASYEIPEQVIGSLQMPLDLVDETSMQSFPCSDPPGYSGCRV
jgi:hypothetical protein